MNVAVCVKQTPSTTAVFTVADGAVSWDDPGGKPLVMNPWDEYAVEEAIRLTENHGANLAYAVSLGEEAALDVLKSSLAMGCKEAVLVSDDSFAGSDSVATARILAATIRKLDDVKIVVFGKQAIDGDSGNTPVQVARKLGWTPLTFVSEIKEVTADSITVERLLEAGKQTVTAPLPVVISVVKEANEPRYPSFMGIRKANRATIPTLSADDIDIDGEVGEASSQVDWSNIYAPPARVMETEMITGGSAEEIAATLADRLMDEKVI